MNAAMVIRRPAGIGWTRPSTDAVRVLCGHCGKTVQAWPAEIGRFEMRTHDLPPIDDVFASVRTPKPCPGINTTLGHTLVVDQ